MMRIATWNVCTLHRAGAMNELVKEMDMCVCVCEREREMGEGRERESGEGGGVCARGCVRWPGKGTLILKKIM